MAHDPDEHWADRLLRDISGTQAEIIRRQQNELWHILTASRLMSLAAMLHLEGRTGDADLCAEAARMLEAPR